MQRNWSYPEFREILYREAKEGEDHINSNPYKRIYAYLKAIELHKAGLSYNMIRKAVKNEVGFTPSKSELSYWLRGLHTPLTKIAVFDVHQPEVGLLLGLILSDGCEYRHYLHNHYYGARQKLFNNDEQLIQEFKQACNKLGIAVHGTLDPPKLGQRCWRLEANSTLLYLLLKRYDVFIIKAPANVQTAFLRGLWLGDGYMNKGLMFINTDLKLIETAERLLTIHGVLYTRQGPYKSKPNNLPRKPYKPRYIVYVASTSQQHFLELINLPKALHASASIHNGLSKNLSILIRAGGRI